MSFARLVKEHQRSLENNGIDKAMKMIRLLVAIQAAFFQEHFMLRKYIARLKIPLSLIFIISSITNPAFGQVVFELVFPTQLELSTAYINNIGNPEIVAKEIRRKESRDRENRYKERDGEDTPEQPQISYATLNYKTSLSRRNATVKKFIDRIRKIDPAAAGSFQKQFEEIDIFSELKKALMAKGLDANNLADAYAVYWVSSWEASNGSVRDSSSEQVQAVRGQVLGMMRNLPQVSEMNEASRQEAAEEMLLTSVVIGASLDSVKDDPVKLKAYAAEMMRQSKTNGLDFTALTLTEKGFELKP
jgi:hypothetical protein